jgi:putative ABC transport system permease protein
MRRPGFSGTVLLTLTLGLGTTATMFTLVNGVLVRDLPYKDPSRLAFIWTNLDWIGVPRAWMSGPHIDRLRREARSVEAIVPLRMSNERLIGAAEPEIISTGWSEADLFDVLGVRPLLGRLPEPDDELRDVVMLGHAIWRRHFGENPAVIGRRVEIGDTTREVIGVLPEDFRFQIHSSLSEPVAVAAWVPMRWALAEMNQGQFSFAALARVRPGASQAQAQAEIDVIGGVLDRDVYRSRGFGWTLVGLQEDLVRTTRPALVLLTVAALVVLVIVCANVSGVMLARGVDRQREFALRSALGASRGQMLRLVLVESLGLALVAGAAGLGLAWAATRYLLAGSSMPVARLAEVSIDWRVALVTLITALGAGLLLGAMPAWRATGVRSTEVLRSASRGSSAPGSRLRSGLVVAEIAFAVMLVAASALLFRSYDAARKVDPGFQASGVLSAHIVLDDSRQEQAGPFFEMLLGRAAGLPGVTRAGGVTSPPLSGSADQMGVRPLDGPLASRGSDEEGTVLSDVIQSTPGYFAAMGLRQAAGRDFLRSDGPAAQPVAIVDERFARAAWPDMEPIGRQMTIGGADPVTVVGVVRQARLYSMVADDRPQVFLPYAQDPSGSLTLVLRVAGDPAGVAAPLRALVHELDPRQPVGETVVMADVVSGALSNRRLQLQILGGFAASALLLALLGVYGVLSALVRERTREIGIRMALGATVGSVRRLVLRRTALLLVTGLGLGLAGAVASARALAHFLFAIGPGDSPSLAATVCLVSAAAMAAALFPIRRAASVDPIVALRAD